MDISTYETILTACWGVASLIMAYQLWRLAKSVVDLAKTVVTLAAVITRLEDEAKGNGNGNG